MLEHTDEVAVEAVPRCDLCGSTEALSMFETRDRQHLCPGTFGLVRCRTCGLVRLSPRPTHDALAGFYPGSDYLPYRPSGIGHERGRRPLGRVRDALRDEALRGLGYPRPGHRWARLPARWARAALVRRHAYGMHGFPPFVPHGRALDVGPGNGFFLALLRQQGWAVQGVDFSPAAAEVVGETFGIDVHVGEITDDVFVPGTFDFVHMSHVVEHVSTPSETLARAHSLLRAGGRLYVETPNISSVGARLWGPLWFPLESPRHLWLFSPRTLRRLLEDTGFRVESMRTTVWDRPEWEATYLFEERTGTQRSPRPSIGRREWPRVAGVSGLSRVAKLVAPLSGDLVRCWATRP